MGRSRFWGEITGESHFWNDLGCSSGLNGLTMGLRESVRGKGVENTGDIYGRVEGPGLSTIDGGCGRQRGVAVGFRSDSG
jgi:hypothetical protein